MGEIGRLFGLGVQTIHYYDRIGLFKPALRDPKTGYRQYRFDQVYQLASIRYMRKMGCSIEDIRRFWNARHPESTSRLLTEQSRALQEQWKSLMRIEDAIRRKMNYIKEQTAKQNTQTAPRVVSFQKRLYIPIGTEKELYMDESFYFYPTVVFYEGAKKSFGALVEKPEEMEKSARKALQVIPAGKYLTAYHRGGYEGIQRKIREIQQANPQYAYHARVVNFNIIDQFVEQDSANFITQIRMRIREDKA